MIKEKGSEDHKMEEKVGSSKNMDNVNENEIDYEEIIKLAKEIESYLDPSKYP